MKLSKSVKHSLEVGLAGLVALGLAYLAVLAFPELRAVLLNPLSGVVITAVGAFFPKAQRESSSSITGDYIND